MKDQKGQALLFVILTMTVAMAVGVGISLRTISSVSRTTRTDTAARVLAAAEGGAENYLVHTISELENDISLCTDASPCEVEFEPFPDDNIATLAEVVVDTYGDEIVYETEVQKDQVKEIYLEGYNHGEIQICWKALSGLDPVDLYFIVYPRDGDLDDMVRIGATQGGVGYPTGHDTNLETATAGSCNDVGGYDYVYTLTGLPGNKTQILRIRPLINGARLAVNSLSGNPLPHQGYKITSVGKLRDVADEVTALKTVVVYKSRPYLPAVWDFGIYTETGSLD